MPETCGTELRSDQKHRKSASNFSRNSDDRANDPDASKSAAKLPAPYCHPVRRRDQNSEEAQVVDQLSWDKEGFATARSQVRCVLWEVCIFVVTGCSGAHFKACQWTCEPITSLTFLIQHHVLQRLFQPFRYPVSMVTTALRCLQTELGTPGRRSTGNTLG